MQPEGLSYLMIFCIVFRRFRQFVFYNFFGSRVGILPGAKAS